MTLTCYFSVISYISFISNISDNFVSHAFQYIIVFIFPFNDFFVLGALVCFFLIMKLSTNRDGVIGLGNKSIFLFSHMGCYCLHLHRCSTVYLKNICNYSKS